MDEAPQSEKKQEGAGPMAAIIIVVILVALGGAYFLITQEIKLRQTLQPENLPAQTEQESS